MPYDLHITRAKHWTDSEHNPITLEEWLVYVAKDAQMRLDGFAECESPDGSVIRIEGVGLAVWRGYSGNGVGGNMVWFDHRSGRIVVARPNDEIVGKMRQIAHYFNAAVIGDDGELY